MTRILTLALALLTAMLITTARAELVEHHGQRVDPADAGAGCIACHDGTVAKAVSSCTVKCDFRSPHAILKEYPPRGREAQFVPLQTLAGKGIRLVNGQVTCVSCHDLRNQASRHLVVPNDGSALCLSCHVK